MREAAMGSTPLLLVVVPASGDVRYGDVEGVMQMAQARGIEARSPSQGQDEAGP